MVSLKKFLFFGVALVSAFPLDGIVNTRSGSALAEREAPSLANNVKLPFDPRDLSGRQIPRSGLASIQWSPQGRIIFLSAFKFPQAVLEGFYALGAAGPARELHNSFRQYLLTNGLMRANALWTQATTGGVYGKGAGAIADTFGFGIQTNAFPVAADLQTLLDALNAWASQGGEIIRVLARPNNFFDLATIGAGETKRGLEARARGNECPPDTDLLQYSTQDLPDVDINTQIRWGGICDE